jgi:NitT/TauT family transport system ATP-binding protein
MNTAAGPASAGPARGRTDAPLLEVRSAAKTFVAKSTKQRRETPALAGVDFTVHTGEFCAIIGPSGCGKSTLLRLVAGLIAPSAGEVVLQGRRIEGPGPDRGMVFQQANLLPWRSALSNVLFSLECSGAAKAAGQQTARDYLHLVGLKGFEDYYPSQLSGGMQQRVGLARALAVEPAILLLDEPFGALDAQTRLLLQGELERIWLAKQTTTLLVTHDIEEAVFLADRIICLTEGPGRVGKIVPIPFARPRSHVIRNDPKFAALKSEVWDQVFSSMSQVGTGKDAETPA